MKIFQRSLRNLFKDPAKIFAKILQDLQGFYQDLARILGIKDPTRIFARILQDP